MAVAVEVGYGHIDRGVNRVAEGLGASEVGGAVIEVDEILPASSVGQNVDVAILINIGELEAADTGGPSECCMVSKASLAVVEKDCIRCGVVADGDVEITVVVEVCEFGGVRGSEVLAQAANQIETGPALIEEDKVLLGPVSSVGDDDIGNAVTIEVADTHRS